MIFQKFVNRLEANAESNPSHAVVEANNDFTAGYKLASDLVKEGTMTAENGLQFFFYLFSQIHRPLRRTIFFLLP